MIFGILVFWSIPYSFKSNYIDKIVIDRFFIAEKALNNLDQKNVVQDRLRSNNVIPILPSYVRKSVGLR